MPGFGPGGIVAIQLPNSADYAAAVMACHWLGAAVLPVNTQWRPEEFSRNLDGLPVSGLIGNRQTLAPWHDSQVWGKVPLLAVEDRPSAPTVAEQDRLEALLQRDLADTSALVLITSGSSGPAKIVIRSHAQLLANARQVGAELRWPAGCRILPVTPFFHANGFSNGLLLPLWSGGRIVLLRQFFPATFVDLIEREAVQVVIGSPVVYESLLRYEVRPGTCRSLEYAICQRGWLGNSANASGFPSANCSEPPRRARSRSGRVTAGRSGTGRWSPRRVTASRGGPCRGWRSRFCRTMAAHCPGERWERSGCTAPPS